MRDKIKNHKGIFTAVLILLLLLIGVVTAIIIMNMNNQGPVTSVDHHFEQGQTKATAKSSDTDDPGIKIPGYTTIKIPANQKEVEVVVTNPNENKVYFQVSFLITKTADLTINGDNAEFSIYVANPVPYGDGITSENGSVTNCKITVDNTAYNGTVDVQNTKKIFSASTGLFKIEEGAELTVDTVTFTLPKSSLESDDVSYTLDVHVNPIMNADVSLLLKVSNIAKSTPAPAPTEETNQNMTVTADVEAPAPSYIVTVPSSVAMGTLSAENDNTKTYSVKVEAANMGDGYLDISTAATGKLTSGSNTLAFSNALSNNTGINDNATVTGTLKVNASNVASAAAVNYTGTANFVISYYAA